MQETLLNRLIELLLRPVPEAVLMRARLHLLDWLGCAVHGHGEIGSMLAETLKSSGAAPGSGPCRGLFHGSVGWQDALQINAGLGNVGEMDDVHRTSTLHPGPVVIPVALALAQQRGRPLIEALRAMVIGYECAIRIGRTLGAAHYARFHNTATMGTPAAAAAASALLGLDRERTGWAIANALSRTGGLWQMRHEDVLTKQWHCIAAALDGTAAAQLAGAGISGPASILEGEQGLYAAMAPDARPDQLIQGDADDWMIGEVSFKPWPACRHAHAALDAALRARSELPDGAEIERAEVFTYADALKFCDNPEPGTDLQAKFSLQHCTALVMAGCEIDLDGFVASGEGFDRLRGARSRVSVAVREDFDSAYPQHYGACVRLHTADGGAVSAEVSDALGDPEAPMSRAMLLDKAAHLMAAGGLNRARSEALQSWALESDWNAPVGGDILP
ncbi:MAG: MmgE/PrpD family protein [Gammaproteobacteria bacterium AqS3]|nr:MmgE/PrpD family protein [Gammaproteobacteria bacterium AqS3]